MWLVNLIPAPYRLIAGLVALAVMLAAASYGGWKLRDYQAAEDQLDQAKVANKALQEKVDEVADLTNRIRKVEQQSVARMVRLQDRHEKEIKNVTTKKDRVIADLRAGLVRLRDPGARPTERAGGNISTATDTATGILLRESGTGLSEWLAEYLVSEASRADEVVAELNYCRSVAVAQHETCNQLLIEALK